MKLGFAQTDITPNRSIPLAGYAGPVRLGQRGERPLMAQAAFLQGNEGEGILLFAVDVLGFEQFWTNQIRDRIHAKINLSRHNIVLNASHTHCGPQTCPTAVTPDCGMTDDEYLAELQDRLVEVGCQAFQKRRSATMRVCQGTNTQVTFRRRWDGKNWNNAPNFDIEPERDLPILDCRWDHGERLLIVIASGHPTTEADPIYCPHYIGRARERLSEALGKETTAMILQGVSGDSKMTTPDPKTGGWIRDMKEDIRIASERITGDILQALSKSKPLDPSFKLITKVVQLPKWKGFGHDFSASEALAMLSDPKVVASWRDLLTGKSISYEMQLLVFTKEYRWVIMGGEPCTGLAHSIKKVFKNGLTYVVGYCNNGDAYIPSRQIAVEGGYEGRRSFKYCPNCPDPLAPDVENVVVQGVEDMNFRAAPVHRDPPGRLSLMVSCLF